LCLVWPVEHRQPLHGSGVAAFRSPGGASGIVPPSENLGSMVLPELLRFAAGGGCASGYRRRRRDLVTVQARFSCRFLLWGYTLRRSPTNEIHLPACDDCLLWCSGWLWWQ